MTKKDKVKEFEKLLDQYNDELRRLYSLVASGLDDDCDYDMSAMVRDKLVKTFEENCN